ncbi:hypothetical protein C8A01DRAFT_20551 [Parachaetomium inaequale]|uniref:Deoxyribonuclease NucA/NucB domain-containing protein n=1 Tax=Parachaetomium inaequale TaxID=2588326 RepID=A0AAN6P5W8_9PEZI|nr:hypothetical protein C8A01DRAFT_20551 [Parachaetomium inaequale]
MSAAAVSLMLHVMATAAQQATPAPGVDYARGCRYQPLDSPRRAGGGWDYIKVEGEEKCVPVLDFFCVEDLFDQMCTSMCQGIRDLRNKKPENVLSDRAVLLHRRMGRNPAAGCANMGCAQRLTYSTLYQQYFSMQCDEFPPASSMEGGGPTLTCISWYQNNLGGIYLRYFYDDVGLTQDQPYVIRMDTCDFPAKPVSYAQGSEPRPHPKKRQERTVKAADSPLWVRDPRSTDSEGYVLMPLEPAGPGTYNGTLSLSNLDSLEDVSIVDGAGGLVWNSTGAMSGQSSLQYEVLDDTQDLFVAARAATSVSVSAAFTATSVPQATGTSSSGAMRSGGGCAPGLLAAGVAVGIIMGV